MGAIDDLLIQMKKEELIYLHALLAHFKNIFGKYSIEYGFKKYEDLNISPTHIYRSKIEHKQAIFVLASELASMVTRLIEEEVA